MIIAGVSTEVCVAFLALSLVKAGYDAYSVIDASGTWNPLVANTAVAGMVQGGVVPMTWPAVGAELQRDWKRSTGAALAKAMGPSPVLPIRDYIAGHFTVTGTHRGVFQEIQTTNRPVTISEFTFYHLEGHKFTEVWDLADMDAVMRQIGQGQTHR
jgi:hypothetical protein